MNNQTLLDIYQTSQNINIFCGNGVRVTPGHGTQVTTQAAAYPEYTRAVSGALSRVLQACIASLGFDPVIRVNSEVVDAAIQRPSPEHGQNKLSCNAKQ